MLLFTFLFFFIFELFSLLVLFKLEFLVSILSSQFIKTFSDFAEVLRLRVDAIKFVFNFFGAEIGSDFFERREFIDIFELEGFFSCFFVMTGFKGRLICMFFIN
jgi:hypothetical protein